MLILLTAAAFLLVENRPAVYGAGGGGGSQADPSITRHIMLGGRQDLRLHFIVSLGIKVIADSGISFAAGEFKELLDALSGGSGFSFADLAADRAGPTLNGRSLLLWAPTACAPRPTSLTRSPPPWTANCLKEIASKENKSLNQLLQPEQALTCRPASKRNASAHLMASAPFRHKGLRLSSVLS
jgi:hypothetical protein